MSERDDQIEILRRLGLTYREISNALDCDFVQINRVVKERNLPCRKSAQAAVEAHIRAGVKPYKAAQIVGVNKSVAYRVQRTMGVTNG